MRGAELWTLDSAMDSLALWWREAGLHTPARDEAVDWRAASQREKTPRAPAAPDPAPAAPVSERASQPARTSSYPADLPGFLAALAGPDQPEATWGGALFTPPAAIGLPLLVVSDAPEPGGAEEDAPFDRPALALVRAMLAAIGAQPHAGFATLALRAPPGGVLTDDLVDALGARLRYYLGLARPRALLIFGDRPARALGVTDGPGRFANLHDVNLAAATIPLVAAPLPALLMRRPAAKAQVWRALRQIGRQIAGVLD